MTAYCSIEDLPNLPLVRCQGDRLAPEGFYTITPWKMNPNSTDDFKAAAELEQVGDKCCEAMILPYGENPSPDVIFRKGQEIA